MEWCNQKKNNISKISFLLVYGLIIGCIILSFIMKSNLINYGLLLIVGINVFIILLRISDKSLITCMLVSSLLTTFITDMFNLPSLLNYIPDFLVLVFLVRLLYKFCIEKTKISNIFIYLLILSITFNILTYCMYRYNFFSFLWGIRNDYRFLVFFLGCASLSINIKYIKKIMWSLCILSVLQIPIIILESKLYPGNFDSYSGTFGSSGTGLLLLFMMLIFSYKISAYLYKKNNLLALLFYTIVVLTPAIIGDLKAMYIFLPITAMFVIFSSGKVGFKKIILILFLSAIIIGGYNLYDNIFTKENNIPKLNITNLSDVLQETYYSSYDLKFSLNRLSAPVYVNNTILNTNLKKLLGIGIGNGSPSQYELLQSNFYINNDYLKYYFFFFPYYLLENGYLGLGVFFIFLFYIFRCSKTTEKMCKEKDVKILCLAMRGWIIALVLSSLYNNALLSDQIGYLFWGMSGLILNLSRNYIKIDKKEIMSIIPKNSQSRPIKMLANNYSSDQKI